MKLAKTLTTSTVSAFLFVLSAGATQAQYVGTGIGKSLEDSSMLTYRVSGGSTGSIRRLEVFWAGAMRADLVLNGQRKSFTGQLDAAELRALARLTKAFFADAPNDGSVGGIGADLEKFRMRFATSQGVHGYTGLSREPYGKDFREQLNALYNSLVTGDRAASKILIEVTHEQVDGSTDGITITAVGKLIRWRVRAGVRVAIQQLQLSATEVKALQSLNLSALASEDPHKDIPQLTYHLRAVRQGVNQANPSALDSRDCDGPRCDLPKQLKYVPNRAFRQGVTKAKPSAADSRDCDGPRCDLPKQLKYVPNRAFRQGVGSKAGDLPRIFEDNPHKDIPKLTYVPNRAFRQGVTKAKPSAADSRDCDGPRCDLPKQLKYVPNRAFRRGVTSQYLYRRAVKDSPLDKPTSSKLTYKVRTFDPNDDSIASTTMNAIGQSAARKQFLQSLFAQLMK
jgi:hypothetical protein